MNTKQEDEQFSLGVPESQKQSALEIFELFQNLLEYIDEFEGLASNTVYRTSIKRRANQNQIKFLAVVLYIKLKLEIFKNSPLFGQIADIHGQD